MGYNMFDSTAGYENAMLPPIITVQGVLPQEGGPGTTIEIYCALRFPETHTTQNRVRLMFGNTALDASVLICPPDLIPPCLNIPPHMINDLYLVQATVPELRAGGPSWKVPMRMEAIVCPYGTDEVAPVEVVELCDFHYLYARNSECRSEGKLKGGTDRASWRRAERVNRIDRLRQIRPKNHACFHDLLSVYVMPLFLICPTRFGWRWSPSGPLVI
jgi:hypothetical protein